MKKITMMQLRKKPGEYFYWLVGRNKESFIITNQGKPVAKIIPHDDMLIENMFNWIRKSDHQNGCSWSRDLPMYTKCSCGKLDIINPRKEQ